MDSSICRRCGAEEETSAHVFCECKALVTLRHTYLGSFFLDPENVGGLSLWAIWNFIKWAGLLWLGVQCKGHRGLVKGLHVSGLKGLKTHYLFLYSIFPSSNHSHYMFLNYKIMYLVNGYLTDSYSTQNSQQHSLHKTHEILYNRCDSRSFHLCICNLPKQCRVGHWRRVACTYVTPDCETLLTK